MRHANNEKRETANDGRNRTTKSRKNQNARKKGTFNYLGILEGDTIKQVEIKEKTLKRIPQENEKTARNQII